MIDIGGRSTEMILGQGRQARTVESFKVGSVSLSMRWFPDGVFTEQRFRNAQVAAGAELEEALTLFAPHLWQEALGSSGTAGAVSQILQAAGLTDGTITPEGPALVHGPLPGRRQYRRPVAAVAARRSQGHHRRWSGAAVHAGHTLRHHGAQAGQGVHCARAW